MVHEREYSKAIIYNEFDEKDSVYWFDFKQRKFLHNIDTFYYSVKFLNDFTLDSKDSNVLQFRKFFKQKYEILENDSSIDFLSIQFDDKILNAYSARTAHPFRRNGAPFRFKLSKAQQVDYLLLVILRSLPGNSRRYALDVIRLKQASA